MKKRMIVLCAAAAGVCGAGELVVNGGFEINSDGTVPGWASKGGKEYRFEAGAGRNGTCALVYENDNPKSYHFPSQRVAAEAGESYAAEVWVRTENLKGGDTGASVCLEWYDAAGKWKGGAYTTDNNVKGTVKDWTLVRLETPAIPEGMATVKVSPYVRKGMTGKVWFDDLRVYPAKRPVVTGVYSSCHQDVSAGGKVTFCAALSFTEKRFAPVCPATGVFTATPKAGGAARVFKPDTLVFDRAEATVDTTDWAPGDYTVAFDFTGAGDVRGRAEGAFTRAAAPPKRAVTIDEHRRAVVDGKPFFPLGMYWHRVNEKDLAVYADSPFNCLMPYSAPNEKEMDLCQARGLKVIYSVKDIYSNTRWAPAGITNEAAETAFVTDKVRRFKDHPALLAWYLNDEMGLEMMPRLEARQALLRALDPGHPTWVVLYQYGLVRSYLRTFDVIGTDPYPVPSKPIDMALEWTRITREQTCGLRAMWQVPQVFDWDCYAKKGVEQTKRAPTPAEVRSMAWQCVAAGANGLVFYSFFDLKKGVKGIPFETRWAEVKGVAEEIARFIPVLLAEPAAAPKLPADAPARSWRTADGAVHTLVVNATAAERTLDVPALADGTVEHGAGTLTGAALRLPPWEAVLVKTRGVERALLASDGSVRLRKAGLSVRPVLSRNNWTQGATVAAGRANRFPDKKTGRMTYTLNVRGTNVVATGETKLTAGAADGTVAAANRFVAKEDQHVDVLGLAVTLPYARAAGGAWRIGGKTGVFPTEHKTVHLARAKADSFTVTLADGRAYTWTFAAPVEVHIQDNFKWSGDSYSLRFGTTADPKMKAGAAHAVAYTLAGPEPLEAAYAEPYVIRAGRDWVPIRYTKDIEAGSALDFSRFGFLDAPAGKHGWLKNADGRFEFEKLPGVPQRFYGVNFCGTMNFPSHAETDTLITRLKRLGYNTIRLHHYDKGTVNGSADGLTLNAEWMDRFDYLCARAIAEGFYLTTDIYVSRNVRWRDIGLDGGDAVMPINTVKAFMSFHPPAMENWKTYARNLLTHRNPYTGRTYAEEPALPLISLVNEGRITAALAELRAIPQFRADWAAWLARARAACPGAFPGATDEPPVFRWGKPDPALAQYMADLERRAATWMRAYLRDELGCRALVTSQNCGPHYTPMQFVREDLYDYVDDHFYVDHPSFLEKRWSLPSRCPNTNPLRGAKVPPCASAFTRLMDKPYTITEYNFSGPGMYRGVGGILTGAMACLQDWDGLWRFAYAHNVRNMHDGAGTPGYFDVSTDPLSQASDRASICLFLRRDLSAFADEKVEEISAADVALSSTNTPSIVPAWADDAWRTRTGTRTVAGPGGTAVAGAAEARRELEIDRARGAFTIDTPRTAGGFAEDGRFTAGPLTVTLTDAAATVWVSALDGAPVRTSRRLLLTHLTDVQGDGAVYREENRQVLLRWGTTPLMRRGGARVELAVADAEKFTVHVLNTSGGRTGTVPARAEGGRLVFDVAVAGDTANFLYELAAE